MKLPCCGPNRATSWLVLTLVAATLFLSFSDHAQAGIVVQDTFTESSDTPLTSHTPDIGTGWTEVFDDSTAVTDAQIIASSDIVEGGSSENFVGQAYTAQPAPSSADQDISITLKVLETDSGTKSVGLFGRRTDNNNFYHVQILPNNHATDSIKLYKFVSGSFTELGTYDATLAVGTVIKLEIRDAIKKVYVDAVERISSTDNELTSAGTWGIYFGSFNSSGTGAHLRPTWDLDNFVAEDPSDVSVSASSSQTASLGIPSTNQYVGGAFVIKDNVGSRNVTGITITEHGTVDALTDLDNIKLQYDLDTSAPYDCASESYGGGEPQFGVTDTDGFSAADGTSSFTGSVSISTTQTMCLYVVLDVGAGATASETLEIKIDDPSSEVTVSTGTVGPGSAVGIAGTTTLTTPANLDQIHFRWRNDDGGEGGHQSTQVSATADTTTTSASDVLVSGMTITPGAGDYHIWFSSSLEGDTGSTIQYVSLYVDGVQLAHSEREIDTESSIPDTAFAVATHARVTGVTAGQAIEVRWRTTGGTATMHERTLVVSEMIPAESTQVSDTADTTTTSASDVLVSGMTITPGAGDYHIWFSSSLESDTGSTTQYVSLYVDGVQLAHSEREIDTESSIPDTAFAVATHARVTGVTAGQAIEVRWRTTGGTATMHERTLVVETFTSSGDATWAATEDTLVSVAKSTIKRVRVEVSNEGGQSSGAVTYQLQVAETNTCGSGSYTGVPTDTSGHWQVVGSSHIMDGEATFNITAGLTDESSTFVAGELKDASNTTGSITLTGDAFTEIEFAVQATNNATDGGHYCFRLYDTTAASPLDTYTEYAKAGVLHPTAVALTSFDVSIQGNAIRVTWVTAQEINNLGFHLHRGAQPQGLFQPITDHLIPGLLSSAVGQSYTYTDTQVLPGNAYCYKLEALDLNGQTAWHGPICVDWSSNSLSNSQPLNAAAGVGVTESGSRETVTLYAWTVTRYGSDVVFQWHMGREHETLGFYLYREQSGRRVRLNPQMIPGSAVMASPGQALAGGRVYTWLERGATGTTSTPYWLERIDIDGHRHWYGPGFAEWTEEPLPKRFQRKWMHQALHAQTKRQQTSMRTRAVRARLRTRPRGPLPGPAASSEPSPSRSEQLVRSQLGGLPLSPTTEQTERQRRLADTPAIKLGIREAGWYQVSQPALVAAGLDSGVDPRTLQLWVDGQEQPLILEGELDGRFDPQDTLAFYGQGLDTPSTDTRIYWLVAGDHLGQRIEVALVPGSGPPGPQSFLDTVNHQERTFYFAALRNGEASNFFGPTVSTEPVDQVVHLPHPESLHSHEAWLEVRLQGATLAPHQVKVLLNDVEVGEVIFDGRDAGELQVPIDHSGLLPGDNLVTLVAQGGERDISLLDTIRVTYFRAYRASDNVLRFTAQGGEAVSVSGFSTQELQVVDITDPHAVMTVPGEVQPGGAGFSLGIQVPGSGMRTLLAFSPEQSRVPHVVTMNHPSAWHDPAHDADLVIITHADFMESLWPLVELREAQGFSVALIDVDDVYDEYTFGHKSPAALKAFFSHTLAHWQEPPQFALLVGDASFDPRNYLGLGHSDFVPTTWVDTDHLETASDDGFVDSDKDGLPEMAVGRLPVRTLDEAVTVVEKLLAYETIVPSNEVLLVADENDVGFDFEAASRRLADWVPNEIAVAEIFRGQRATARNDLLAHLNRGPAVVNYFGHGSVEVWEGGLFTRADATTLTNGSQLPVWIAVTCLNGFFHDLYTESLAESLLKAEQGGAVAVWTSSGLTLPDGQAQLNQELFRLLFQEEGLTLGEATMRAKLAVDNLDIRRTTILFGDPTLRLR